LFQLFQDQKNIGTSQSLFGAQREAFPVAFVIKHQHSSVLVHLIHEDATPQTLQPQKEEDSAAMS
jgi:hypothetical protein